MSTQPALRAFSVIKRKDQDDFWLAIGAAFPHKDAGFNVILQALPIPDADGVCKIVLRPPKDDDDRNRDNNDRGNGRGSRQDNNRDNQSGSRRR